jgi:hypothetical protein
MKWYRADSRIKIWRFSDVSGTNSIPATSANLHILIRLSAREYLIEFCRLESYKTYVKTFPDSIIIMPPVLGLFRHLGFPIRKRLFTTGSTCVWVIYENIEQFDILVKSSFWLPDQFCKFPPQKKIKICKCKLLHKIGNNLPDFRVSYPK